MRTSKARLLSNLLIYTFLIIGVFCILFPFYITLITALKTQQESSQSFFSFPSGLYLDNFVAVFQKANYFMYVRNSTVVTVCSVVLIYLFTPLCSYAISRNMRNSRYFQIVFVYLLSGIFVPFQVVMIPMVTHMSNLGLNNRQGLILLHLTFAATQATFLLVNYIRAIPPDLEEAASIDGCTIFGTYWRIVLPLIKPMTATVLVLNALWVWNDFQMPLLILNTTPNMWTLPLFQYNFKTEYSFDYNLAFASYLISMIPVLVAYGLAQRHIVAGLTQGAVKT